MEVRSRESLTASEARDTTPKNLTTLRSAGRSIAWECAQHLIGLSHNRTLMESRGKVGTFGLCAKARQHSNHVIWVTHRVGRPPEMKLSPMGCLPAALV
jgi:hypothetical protein